MGNKFTKDDEKVSVFDRNMFISDLFSRGNESKISNLTYAHHLNRIKEDRVLSFLMVYKKKGRNRLISLYNDIKTKKETSKYIFHNIVSSVILPGSIRITKKKGIDLYKKCSDKDDIIFLRTLYLVFRKLDQNKIAECAKLFKQLGDLSGMGSTFVMHLLSGVFDGKGGFSGRLTKHLVRLLDMDLCMKLLTEIPDYTYFTLKAIIIAKITNLGVVVNLGGIFNCAINPNLGYVQYTMKLIEFMNFMVRRRYIQMHSLIIERIMKYLTVATKLYISRNLLKMSLYY